MLSLSKTCLHLEKEQESQVNIKNFNTKDVLQSFLSPQIDCGLHEKEILEMWKKIAIEECKEYLRYSLNSVGFPYILNDKTWIIFENLLKNFSVSQVFGLISRCLGYTTKEFQSGKLSRKVAGAYLLGAVQIQAERAMNKGWSLSKFLRPRELPQSQLSIFFFEGILNIGEKGFNEKISETFFSRCSD